MKDSTQPQENFDILTELREGKTTFQLRNKKILNKVRQVIRTENGHHGIAQEHIKFFISGKAETDGSLTISLCGKAIKGKRLIIIN